jgi:hypothetical protein
MHCCSDFLLILTRLSLNEPTKECSTTIYLTSAENLEKDKSLIQKKILNENISEFYSLHDVPDDVCPYVIGYKPDDWEKYNNVLDRLNSLDDLILIEFHTSYIFIYTLSVYNIKKGGNVEHIIFEH